MSVDGATLVEYAGKKVILHLQQDDGTLAELEGKVEDASEVGIAFKEKGKRDISLILPHQVEEISLAPNATKKVVQKKLKLVTITTVRQHLADRHGRLVSELNGMTDEQAWAEHEAIDHSDLGHRHEAKTDDSSNESETDDSEE